MTNRADISDEALMIRYQRGDKGAFTALVRRHQTPLFNFAYRQLRAQSQAEDVVQEAFVRVVQNAHEFKHEARFTTWVYTITRNLCIDQLRKRALRHHKSLDDSRTGEEGEPTLGEQTADSRASVEREATGSELKERIVKALDKLPDEQREVFLDRGKYGEEPHALRAGAASGGARRVRGVLARAAVTGSGVWQGQKKGLGFPR
jgi:RNA polymerase sigma-70 factor (ECF subfamily)